MIDWLLELGPGARVLDIASGPGSFPVAGLACSVVAIDEDTGAFTAGALPEGPYWRVFGQSERLPLATASFDLIICNHALEHLSELDDALGEIRRVLKHGGRLYVSVPYGYGVCDRIYRWVFEGGGHVNRFRLDEVVALVEARTGLKLAAWQKLHSSFVYLQRLARMLEAPPPGLAKRIMQIGKLPRPVLTIAQHVLYRGTRLSDRWLRTHASLYGWAFWFDLDGGATERRAYINVCLYCGGGFPVEELRIERRSYCCPSCGGRNPFTQER